MALSEELVSEFAKITNDETNEVKDSVVYGTIAIINGAKYVQIDGADENTLTPVNSTVEVSDGDRVVVMLKNHQAVIQGNLTDNSAGMNGIDLKFDPENLIQQINLNASETKINGDNLDVDASTLDLTANREFNLKLGSNQVIHAINNSTEGGVDATIKASKLNVDASTLDLTANREFNLKLGSNQVIHAINNSSEGGVDATIKASKLTVDASTLDLTANREFNLKLGSNQVIHAINNSSESGVDATIKANKINITGAVTFNSLDSDLASMFNSSTAPSGAVTSSTINNMFTVNNSSPYYFNWGQTTRLTPTNIGVNSSIAITTLTAKYNGSFSFYYDFITEARYDIVRVSITHNGSTTYIPGLSEASGTMSGNKNVSISAGDIIRFEYQKDSSSHAADERVRFYDMYFSGVSSTVIKGSAIQPSSISADQLAFNAITSESLTASGSTKIDGSRIQSGVIAANYLATNISKVYKELQLGSSSENGYINFKGGTELIYVDSNGFHISSSLNNMYIGTVNDVKIESGTGKVILNAPSGSADCYIAFCSGGTEKVVCGGSSLRPADNRNMNLGDSSHHWTNVYYGTTSLITSDRNKKTNIKYDVDKFDILFDKLKPASFKMIDGTSDRTHVGLIAQEVEEAIIESGFTTQDYACVAKEASEDNPDEINYFLRYGEFVGLLIDQVQKLKKRVDELETKLEGLA